MNINKYIARVLCAISLGGIFFAQEDIFGKLNVKAILPVVLPDGDISIVLKNGDWPFVCCYEDIDPGDSSFSKENQIGIDNANALASSVFGGNCTLSYTGTGYDASNSLIVRYAYVDVRPVDGYSMIPLTTFLDDNKLKATYPAIGNYYTAGVKCIVMGIVKRYLDLLNSDRLRAAISRLENDTLDECERRHSALKRERRKCVRYRKQACHSINETLRSNLFFQGVPGVPGVPLHADVKNKLTQDFLEIVLNADKRDNEFEAYRKKYHYECRRKKAKASPGASPGDSVQDPRSEFPNVCAMPLTETK